MFQRALEKKKSRGWEKIFVCVDLHNTIIQSPWRTESGYSSDKIEREPFPYALRTLRVLSERYNDVSLILWSSSKEENLRDIVQWLKHNRITIDYINENPEVPNTETADFSSKFYFNVLIDDKAGFDGATDWKVFWEYLSNTV